MIPLPKKQSGSSFCALHFATRKAHRRRRGVFALGLGLALAGWAAPSVQAANDAYSVDATSGVFSTSFTLGTNTPTTGGTSSPASGDSLFFGTETTGTTAVSNDLTGFTFAGITFNSGASTFTIAGNAFTLTSGITNASAATETFGNAITISGANVLSLTNGGTITLNGSLTGSGALSQTGAATGVTAVNFGGDNSGFTGSFTQDNASSTRTTFSTATAGSAAAAWTFNRNIGGGVALNFAAGTINFGSLSGGGFIRNNIAGTDVLSVGALNTSTTFSGLLQTNGSDLIALTKVGTGTLTLSGANTYTGATTIANGTLALATTGTLGTTSGVTLGDATANTSGVLQLGDASGAANVTLGGLATAGTGTGNAVVGGSTVTSTLTFNDAAATTVAVALGGVGTNQNNLALTKTAAGALTLTAANTYTGATAINGGTLSYTGTGSSANSAVTLGALNGGATTTQLTIAPSAAGTVTRGASLTVNGNNGTGNNYFNATVTGTAAGNTNDAFTGALALNSGTLSINLAVNAASNQELTFGSFSRNAGTAARFNGTVGTQTIASATVNTSNVVFNTAPTLVGNGVLPGVLIGNSLATYNTTNGLTALATSGSITDGAVTTNNVSNMTTGSTSTVNSTATISSLQLGGSPTAVAINGTGTLTVSSGMIALTQANVFNVANLDFGTAEGFVYVANIRLPVINSVITGSGGFTVSLFDANNNTAGLVLNGANTYTGTTAFTGNNSSMTVRLTNSLALQNTTLDYNNYGASFTFGNGTTTGQTAYTFGGLKGAQNINLNNNNTTVGAVALTIGSAGSTDTAATVNTYSGVLSNTVAGGSIIKAGPATQVFSGANTYSGGTMVNAGTLLANNTTGSGTGTGAVQVNAGTLGGTGIITGAVTVASSAVLQGGAGAATGMLTLSAVPTLNSGSLIGLTLLGAANIHSTLALPAGSNPFNANQMFVLGGLQTGTYDNIITGVAAGINTTGWTITNASGATYAFTDDGANIDLSVTAVPEPSTWAAGLLTLVAVGFHQRRKLFGMKSARIA